MVAILAPVTFVDLIGRSRAGFITLQNLGIEREREIDRESDDVASAVSAFESASPGAVAVLEHSHWVLGVKRGSVDFAFFVIAQDRAVAVIASRLAVADVIARNEVSATIRAWLGPRPEGKVLGWDSRGLRVAADMDDSGVRWVAQDDAVERFLAPLAQRGPGQFLDGLVDFEPRESCAT